MASCMELEVMQPTKPSVSTNKPGVGWLHQGWELQTVHEESLLAGSLQFTSDHLWFNSTIPSNAQQFKVPEERPPCCPQECLHTELGRNLLSTVIACEKNSKGPSGLP